MSLPRISERVIGIQGLQIMAHVGVPDEERAIDQKLLFDLRFASLTQPEHLNDDLALTVDYDAFSRRVAALAAERPRKLIETLADELAEILLREFSLSWIELTIRKFILPQTEWVSVTNRREANGEKAET